MLPDNASLKEHDAYQEGFGVGYTDRLLGRPYSVSKLCAPEYILGYDAGYYSDELEDF